MWSLATRALTREHGLGAVVDLGPALLRDVLAYAAERLGAIAQSEEAGTVPPPGPAPVSPEIAVAEAIELLVFPQLEGADDGLALDADDRIDALFAEPEVRRELHRGLRNYFPTLQRRS